MAEMAEFMKEDIPVVEVVMPFNIEFCEKCGKSKGNCPHYPFFANTKSVTIEELSVMYPIVDTADPYMTLEEFEDSITTEDIREVLQEAQSD